MKKLLWTVTSILALAVVHSANAQDWWIGARGGPSIPQLSGGGNEVSKGYSSILAPNFGLVVERTFTGNFSLLAEIDYSGQGGQRNGLQPVVNGPPPYLYANFRNKSELDYLEIPVLAKYEWALDDNWRLFVEGGPYVGYLLRAMQYTRGSSPLYLDSAGTIEVAPSQSFHADTNNRDSLNKINAGAMAGAGIGYLLTPADMIYFDVRGEYGLTTVQKNTAQDGRSNTGSAAFLFGYKHCFSGG